MFCSPNRMRVVRYFCPWTFFYSIELIMFSSDSLMSDVYFQLGYCTGEFQALQMVSLVVLGPVDEPHACCISALFLKISFNWRLICKLWNTPICIVYNSLLCMQTYLRISQHLTIDQYLEFCLPQLHVSRSALFLPSTTVLSLSMDVVLTLSFKIYVTATRSIYDWPCVRTTIIILHKVYFWSTKTDTIITT